MNKHDILKQIKRIATENGGKPPGRKLFENETGARESDWRGRYWAKWNDAIREAGLEPNEKTLAFEDDFLLEHLITLIRELGNFPTSSELRLKRSNDPAFPSDTTYRKFGGMQLLISKVLAYCIGRPEYADVLAICKSAIKEEAIDHEEDGAEYDTETQIGYVYLGKSGKHYKIGRSAAPGQRERQLALLLPEIYVELHRIATDDPVGIERYWHERLASKWKNGEFFLLYRAD